MAVNRTKLRQSHADETRKKIKAGVIIQRLTKHIEADAPLLDASQVSAARVLLNKVLPDLKATEISGALGLTKDPSEMTDEELAAIASTGRATSPKP